MVLLPGDLLDRPQGCREEALALAKALEAMAVPVFIAPGNHDHLCPGSPYLERAWPGNVHIFTRQALESVTLPELSCRVWGSRLPEHGLPRSSGGLPGNRTGAAAADGPPRRPHQSRLPCCPVTRAQAAASGLAYLALGHIHTQGQMEAGSTLCAWPGCPMGRGFDETGVKGVYICQISPQGAQATFRPLGGGVL